MFSIHRFDKLIYEHLDVYILICSNISTVITSVFFIYFVLSLILYKFTNIHTNSFFKNSLLFFYWGFILILWIFFVLKLYITFKLLNIYDVNLVVLLHEWDVSWNASRLGDTLIFLCLTTLLTSWIFLSERYINSNCFHTTYFFIFVVFTINMVYTNNLFIMFIFFEFIFLPSLFFVYVLGYSKKVEKTIKYLLLWTLSGSFLVLISLIYLYNISMDLTIDTLKYIRFTNLEKNILFFCIFLGFGIKIPVWPFHYWLTKVHVEAPTGFSIFLSGYLVKTALFCLIIFINFFKHCILGYLYITIIIWGIIDASIRMWTSTDIKRLIAFATIQEMNLIMFFGFFSDYTNYQIFNIFIIMHGILSSLLFFLVDQVQKRYQSRNLLSLSGLVHKFLNLSIAIWLGLLIFRGFPIFIKFIIEWEFLVYLYEHWGIYGILIFFITTVFSVIGFARVWFTVLYGQPLHNSIIGTDMLKTDKFIALVLISFITFLSIFLCFF